ncbi:SCO1860 family LAETG-anchored protein [Streptomyces sp. ODS05-4]|uniref:SCO1860 family LAETG-anchored protein n=1 Tax=Streptomyces sp. ODS05-4 TaxID=2944939 RepID=UPI00210F1C31|nr:SCO1860 family LAETG-anchored protein [Streptomyces sp. ODS05-4]
MNSDTFRLPAARRTAAAVTALAFTAGPLALAAPTAYATGGGEGKAGAAVLRTDLDTALLGGAVRVPLTATLNEVQAPVSADKTALTVTLDGVDQGRPVQVLRADAATASATVDERRAEGRTELADARLHVPGLPLLPLLHVEQVTSRARCETGRQPVAEANVLGGVTVLGKRTTLSAGGPTRVTVPGVGEVTLQLSKTATTTRTAAATALSLDVAVDPLKLNVAKVTGSVVLAEATCQTPKAPAAAPDPEPAAPEPADPEPQTGAEPEQPDLAATGGSSTTPYLAGGAIALLAAGGGALALTRRTRAHRD